MTGRESHKAFRSETNKAKTSELNYSSSENRICTHDRKDMSCWCVNTKLQLVMTDNSALYILYIYIHCTAHWPICGSEELWKICERIRLNNWLRLDFWKVCGRTNIRIVIILAWLNLRINSFKNFWMISGRF